MARVAVMGAGSWGTAFGMILCDAGGDVVLWAREPEVQESINVHHRNDLFHPGVAFPEQMRATGDPAEALEGASLVILAIPAQTLATNLTQWRDLMAPDSVVVSLMKGIELGTMRRMSQVIAEDGGIPAERVAVVSGPNLAREIALRAPAATTVACPDEASARRLQDACTTSYFRPYWTTDVVGAEIGGSVKNVIAIAAGVCDGFGLGDNAKAALITRGLAEIARLGAAMGANPLTFAGLSGMGDLIVTCASRHSRNRAVGEQIAAGKTLDAIQGSTPMVAEGVRTTRSTHALALRCGIEMPITAQVYRILFEGQPARHAIDALMMREPKPERG